MLDSRSRAGINIMNWTLVRDNFTLSELQLSFSFTVSDLSFIPLDGPDSSPDLDCVVPVRKVAVSEILPLTLVGGEVSLGLAPTNSALPLSPIFIKTNSLNNNNSNSLDNKLINISEYYNGNPAGLLDNLEEITSLPNDFLNIGEFLLSSLSPSRL